MQLLGELAWLRFARLIIEFWDMFWGAGGRAGGRGGEGDGQTCADAAAAANSRRRKECSASWQVSYPYTYCYRVGKIQLLSGISKLKSSFSGICHLTFF